MSIIVDEGDYGTAASATSSSTGSWRSAIDKFKKSTLLFVSATKPERNADQPPFVRSFLYRDADAQNTKKVLVARIVRVAVERSINAGNKAQGPNHTALKYQPH